MTDDNGQFSTSSDWASHKNNTNAGKTSEDGIWFGTSEPDDSKGALIYDTYIIEELRCENNKGFEPVSYTHLKAIQEGDIIRTDGTTTLGGDDKSGITAILEACLLYTSRCV